MQIGQEITQSDHIILQTVRLTYTQHLAAPSKKIQHRKYPPTSHTAAQ